jgi:hypothetical protein
MKKILLCIFLLFSSFLPLVGQESPGDSAKRETGRLVWFVYTAMPEGVTNPVKVLGGKEVTEVKLDAYMASDPVKIPDDGIIRIVRDIPAAPEIGGKTKYAVLAEAEIPESVRKALIILSPKAKAEGDLLFHAKVQDLASFKGGDRLFINLSDTNIGVKIGDTAVAVPAKQATIYSSPKLAEPANMPIIYNYYHPEQKKWKLLTATTVVIMPTRREICVFNNGPRLGKIEKHKIIFPVM